MFVRAGKLLRTERVDRRVLGSDDAPLLSRDLDGLVDRPHAFQALGQLGALFGVACDERLDRLGVATLERGDVAVEQLDELLVRVPRGRGLGLGFCAVHASGLPPLFKPSSLFSSRSRLMARNQSILTAPDERPIRSPIVS